MGIVTYPHQRVVNVRREPINADFLGIKNENWQYAARDLKPFGCMLYLYLASNRNNYKLALSPAAVRQAIGMAQSTYRDQFNVLLEKGYLVQTGGNTFDFYEKPRAAARENEETRAAFDYNTSAADLNKNEQAANIIDLENIEINNTFQTTTETNSGESIPAEYIPRDDELYTELFGADEPSDFDFSKIKKGEFVFWYTERERVSPASFCCLLLVTPAAAKAFYKPFNARSRHIIQITAAAVNGS